MPTKRAENETTDKKQAPPSSTEGAALLEAIYAAPGDDGPRAVYADWLLERGDLHGELISLQLARAAGEATEATQRREAELACENYRAWGGLGDAARYIVFARGFATHVQLHRWPVEVVAAAPAWATVETIGFEDTESDDAIEAILRGPGTSVTGLLDVTPELLGALDLERIERLEGIFVDDGVPEQVLGWLRSARRARRLRLTVDEDERMSLANLEKLLAAPGPLEHLVLERTDELHELVEAVEASSIRTLTVHEWFGEGAMRFERDDEASPFTRVRVWREATGHIKQHAFNGRSLSIHLPEGRERGIVVDVREPHVPGIHDWWAPSRHIPTEEDLAELGGPRVETGLFCPLEELSMLGWS